MSRRKLLGTAFALVFVGSVAFAANRMRDTTTPCAGNPACAPSAASGMASGSACPYAGTQGAAATLGSGLAADATAPGASSACPHDASGSADCPHGPGADAGQCPMHAAQKAEAQALPDCCKGEKTTP